MAITESEAGTHEAEETEANVRKRKDETSRVLVYNSYIYPTLGNIPVTLHCRCNMQSRTTFLLSVPGYLYYFSNLCDWSIKVND